MNYTYNEIILVDGQPAILLARSGAVEIFHRISAQMGITGERVTVNTATERDRISFFSADMNEARDFMYETVLSTSVEPDIMHVYKPILPFLANKRHIFDIMLTDSNR